MKTYLNLLPFSYRQRALVRLRLMQWSALWAAGLVIALVVGVIKYARYQNANDAMESHERQYAPIGYLSDEIKLIKKQLADLTVQETVLEQLRDDRPALTLVGLVSRGTRVCDGRVRVQQLTLERQGAKAVPTRGRASGAATPGVSVESPAKLTLQGSGLDNLAVARFVVALRDTGAFDQVDLKSSLGKDTETGTDWTYIVECQFR